MSRSHYIEMKSLGLDINSFETDHVNCANERVLPNLIDTSGSNSCHPHVLKATWLEVQISLLRLIDCNNDGYIYKAPLHIVVCLAALVLLLVCTLILPSVIVPPLLRSFPLLLNLEHLHLCLRA